MDDFIHNLRMGKNRPYDRKRRHYDNSKFKGNAPPSSRGKKGPSGRNIGPENLGQVKKTLDEIVANQKRLIEIAEKTAASAERKADALEIIAASIARFGTQGQADTQVIAETAEKNAPLTPSPPPSLKKRRPKRQIEQSFKKKLELCGVTAPLMRALPGTSTLKVYPHCPGAASGVGRPFSASISKAMKHSPVEPENVNKRR